MLDGFGDTDVEGCDGVVCVLRITLVEFILWCWGVGTNHQGVDTRVEEAEHPDSGRHEAHSSPHAKHSSSVVVSLESRASLSLCQDNSGINDLVELGQVEEVSVKRQSLIPHASALESGSRLPRRGDGRVGACVSGASVTVQLAQRVDDADEAVSAVDGGDGAVESLVHANEGPGRVDGEEDVVQHHQPAECGGLGDGPWLVAARGVDFVEGYDGDGVDGGDGEGDAGIVGRVVDAGWDGEWGGEGGRARWRRGEGGWVGGGRELEECFGGEAEVDGGRHGGG